MATIVTAEEEVHLRLPLWQRPPELPGADDSNPAKQSACRAAGFGQFEREIIGRSPPIRAVLKQVQIVAPTSASVLIHGETGTGKELVARAVHTLSPRRHQPFARINCAAIPSALLESELFGYEKGAFTGATARKLGRFELAHQGTIFLDEVGDIPAELQPKLLRVLQEQEFERLGSSQVQRVDVRLVAATSRDLPHMVAQRQFRSDLYYRLNVFPIRVPALRQRPADIPLLVRHFVEKYARQLHKQIETVPEEVMESLKRYHWPGNVRELQNFIHRAVIISSSNTLDSSWTEWDLTEPPGLVAGTHLPSRPTTLEQCEREHILQTLSQTGWVVGGPSGAAARLGLKRTTLICKMQKLGITRASQRLTAALPVT